MELLEGPEGFESLWLNISEFNARRASRSGIVPHSLENFLLFVAKTGNVLFSWDHVKFLYREKLAWAMGEFGDEKLIDEEVEIFARFDIFCEAPFTIQRLTELILEPKRHYSCKEKYLRAVEKCLWVSSTVVGVAVEVKEEKDEDAVKSERDETEDGVAIEVKEECDEDSVKSERDEMEDESSDSDDSEDGDSCSSENVQGVAFEVKEECDEVSVKSERDEMEDESSDSDDSEDGGSCSSENVQGVAVEEAVKAEVWHYGGDSSVVEGVEEFLGTNTVGGMKEAAHVPMDEKRNSWKECDCFKCRTHSALSRISEVVNSESESRRHCAQPVHKCPLCPLVFQTSIVLKWHVDKHKAGTMMRERVPPPLMSLEIPDPKSADGVIPYGPTSSSESFSSPVDLNLDVSMPSSCPSPKRRCQSTSSADQASSSRQQDPKPAGHQKKTLRHTDIYRTYDNRPICFNCRSSGHVFKHCFYRDRLSPSSTHLLCSYCGEASVLGGSKKHLRDCPFCP